MDLKDIFSKRLIVNNLQTTRLVYRVPTIDPIRIVQKFNIDAPVLGKVPEYVANYHHPDFRTTVSVLPMSRIRPDVQLRKIRIKKDILGIP